MRSFGLLAALLAITFPCIASYKLSPDDGQAEIGAYHVQPGRCASVEQSLGRKIYDNFFHNTPLHTSFTPTLSTPPSSDDAGGTGIESMDATSLCAFNPELTQGYGGGFDQMRLYLVYSRCIYGSNEMRVLCGQTDGQGKPTKMINVVQATCPPDTKCKNLCATKRDPALTSPYAAKQVQLAQCMPTAEWVKITEMYKPKAASAGIDNNVAPDPKDLLKPDHKPTTPPPTRPVGGQDPPKNTNPQPARQDPKQPGHRDHMQTGLIIGPPGAAQDPAPEQPQPKPQPRPQPAPPKQQAPPEQPARHPQKAPTPMGF